jgi:hypothetical protein
LAADPGSDQHLDPRSPTRDLGHPNIDWLRAGYFCKVRM